MKRTLITVLAAMMTITAAQAENIENVAQETVSEAKAEKPAKQKKEVVYDENGDIIKEAAYEGKTINVKGIVDHFNGKYQIKVFSASDISIVG